MADLRDNAEKNGIGYTYRGTGKDSSLLWTSLNRGQGKSNTPLDPIYEQNIAQFLSGSEAGMGIIKSASPASWSYVRPQKTIEDLLSMRAGEDVFLFDVENIGTFDPSKKSKLDWYSPTEIAFGHAKIQKNYTLASQREGISLLVKPGENELSKIDDLIKKVSGASASWAGLNAEEHRTLNDLILYGSEKPLENGHFTKASSGATYLNVQNRSQQAPNGFIFKPNQVAAMKRGRDNLVDFGSTPDQLVAEIHGYIGNRRGFRLGGYNSDSYDKPFIVDYLRRLEGKVETDSGKHSLDFLLQAFSSSKDMDTLQTIRVLHKDPMSLFGKNLKQEEIARKLGLNKGQSHQALADLNTTMQIHNYLVEEVGMFDEQKSSVRSGPVLNTNRPLMASFNMEKYKIGENLFSISGMGNGHVGKHDMTYRMEDGKMVPQYDNFKTSPILKNTRYQLDKTSTMEINGVAHYAVGLKNLDDDLYHLIVREDPEDLKSLVTKHMLPEQEALPQIKDRKTGTKLDRARRRYLRMFSPEGGVGQIEGMLKGLSVSPNASDDELKAAMRYKNKAGKWQDASDEFVRDFKSIRGRLGEEKEFIEEFLGEIKRSPIAGNSLAEGTALNHYRRLLDEEFGENKRILFLPEGQKMIPLKIDGEEHLLSMESSSTIQSGLKQAVNSGHTYSNAEVNTVKKRLRSIVDQLYTKGEAGLSSSSRNRILTLVNTLEDTNSLQNLYVEIAGRLEQEVQTEKARGITGFGYNHIEIEDPTRLSSRRSRRMNDPVTGMQAKKSSIFQRAINNATPIAAGAWVNGKADLGSSPIMNKFLEQHDQTMQRMVRDIGADPNDFNVKSASESLAKLASAFAKDDMEVAFLHDDRHKGLVMVMANKKDAERIFGLQANEIIEHDKVAAIKIPMLDGRGQLVLPGQQRMSRLITMEDRSGQVRMGTGFDAVIDRLTRSASSMRTSMEKGRYASTQSWGNSIVRETLQSLSTNNRKMSDLNEVINYDDKKSKLARRLIANQVDVTGFARQWYVSQYGQTDMDKITKAMDNKPGTTFFEAMSGHYQKTPGTKRRIDLAKQFNNEIDDWLAQDPRYRLQLNMANVKDVHAAQNIHSATGISAQEYTPFGYFNSMTRENIQKSVNYLPLDRTTTVEGLRKRYSDSIVDRYVNRPVTTDIANQVMDGELGYLNMRAAYMGEGDLRDLAKEKGVKLNPLQNTYEGTFIIRESAAEGFTSVRQKNIKMAKGATMNSEIWAMLQEHGEVDETGVIRIKDGVAEEIRDLTKMSEKITAEGDPRKGFFTVGKLMQDDKVRQSYDYKVRNEKTDKALIRGFDPSQNMLILDEVHRITDGDKMVTDAGHRVTARLVKDEVLNQLGMKDVDMILPKTELKKEQFGSYVKSQVAFVLDEAHRNIEKSLTVGSMKKAEMMDEAAKSVRDMMQRHLGVNENDVVVENGRLVMSGKFGLLGDKKININNVHDFVAEASTKLGFDPTYMESKFVRGQEGLAVADVYNWEDDMGRTYRQTAHGQAVENVDGLVRWGMKEVNAITSRADRHLGKDNEVSKWLSAHTHTVSRAQNSGVDTYAKGLIQAALDGRNADLRAGNVAAPGEVVIKTRGESFSPDDREGLRTAIKRNGVTEVSFHAFNEVPEIAYKGQQRTVGDYQKTVVSMTGTNVDIYDGNQITGESLDDLIRNNKGSALFELPDDSFDTRYVRFLNSDISSIPINEVDNMPVLDDIQRSQLRIANLTREYQEASMNRKSDDDKHVFDVRKNLKSAIADHQANIAKAVNSSDGYIARKVLGSMQDMSGRYRTQGVNPLDPGQYKEGSMYVGRERMGNMIDGAEYNIGKNVYGMDFSDIDMNSAEGKVTVKNLVLDEIEKKGLYGFVNRYPTIHESTNAILKVEIDRNLERTAVFREGTAAAMKIDYDGDFVNNVLTHYRYDQAGTIHGEMGKIHQASMPEFEEWGQHIRHELEQDAARSKVSIGELWQDADYRETLTQDLSIRRGGIYDKETAIARLGKSDVGVLDNLREKISRRTEDLFGRISVLAPELAEQARGDFDRVAELGRMFSQEAISAKKFQVSSIAEEIRASEGISDPTEVNTRVRQRLAERVLALQELQEGVQKPNAEGLQKIRSANDILGVFTPEDRTTKQRFGFDEMLGSLTRSWERLGSLDNWTNEPSINMFMSQGNGYDKVGEALMGVGGTQVMSPQLRQIASFNELTEAGMARSNEYTTSLVQNAINRENGMSNMGSMLMEEQAKPLSQELLTDTRPASESAGVRFRDMAERFLGGAGSGGGRVGMGAIGAGTGVFAGLWAVSAITRSGPTPEETIRGKDGVIQDAAPQGSAMGMLKSPTARVTPSEDGENINISISSRQAAQMSEQQIAALVHGELSTLMPMQLNMNMNVQDNTANLDQSWLQGIVAQAMNGGRIV